MCICVVPTRVGYEDGEICSVDCYSLFPTHKIYAEKQKFANVV
jgi:hypothetical protein